MVICSLALLMMDEESDSAYWCGTRFCGKSTVTPNPRPHERGILHQLFRYLPD
jgi:hypothetical protein